MQRNMSEPETQPETTVKVEGSHVFFYCEVCDETVTELITMLTKLETELFIGLAKLGLHDVQPRVTLHIMSPGGDLYAGLAAMDHLKNMRAHVTTIADGCVASAASLIFLGGTERVVRRNAYVLIHQMSTEFWGKYEDLKDEMRQCEKLMRRLKRVYLKETGLPEKKLDRLLKRDLYLSFSKCVKYCVTRP
jgi:ATP-dependent protease ClpP protease subunit